MRGEDQRREGGGFRFVSGSNRFPDSHADGLEGGLDRAGEGGGVGGVGGGEGGDGAVLAFCGVDGGRDGT